MKNLYLTGLVCLIWVLTFSCKKDSLTNTLVPNYGGPAGRIEGTYFFTVADSEYSLGVDEQNDSTYYTLTATKSNAQITIDAESATTIHFYGHGADYGILQFVRNESNTKHYTFQGNNFVVNYYPKNDSISALYNYPQLSSDDAGEFNGRKN